MQALGVNFRRADGDAGKGKGAEGRGGGGGGEEGEGGRKMGGWVMGRFKGHSKAVKVAWYRQMTWEILNHGDVFVVLRSLSGFLEQDTVCVWRERVCVCEREYTQKHTHKHAHAHT